LLGGSEHAKRKVPGQYESGSQEQPDHRPAGKDQPSLLRGLGLRGGACAHENTKIGRDRRLRFNPAHLAELLQRLIVQGPKSLRCAFQFTHPSLHIAIGAFFAHRSRHSSSKLVILGTRKLVVLAERSRDTLLFGGNPFAHLLHPVADLDRSQVALSNTTFYVVRAD
jgi:hypothetical protein